MVIARRKIKLIRFRHIPLIKLPNKPLNTRLHACIVTTGYSLIKQACIIYITFTKLVYFSIYLASISDIVTLLMEQFSSFISESSDDSSWTELIKNAGCFGGQSWRASFESIKRTSSMEGLSFAWSHTHKKPIWMHFNTSDGGHDSSRIIGSISSKPLLSFHNCHAWYKSSCTQNVNC